MSVFGRGEPFLVGIVLLFGLAGAWAQNADGTPTDLNEGKTAPQLFAADCAVCHNKPQGLAKDKGARALSSFLRQHYTSSIQTADALAAFLTSAGPGSGPATPPRRGAGLPGAEPAAVPRRGGETGTPAFEVPSGPNQRRASAPGSEPGVPVRPPRRLPDAAGRPDGKPESPAGSRRPASAEAHKPAVAPAVENKPAQPAPEPKPEARPEAKPEPKPAPKPTLEEIFD